MVEPSVIPSTALAMDSYVLLIKASSWLFLEYGCRAGRRV